MSRTALHRMRALFLALLILSPAACKDWIPDITDVTGIPTRAPDILGVVTMKPSGVTGFAFEVDAAPPESIGPMFLVRVDGSTRFLKQSAAGSAATVDAALADVVPGAGVSVWFKEPSTGGNPSTGTAELVVIAATGSN